MDFEIFYRNHQAFVRRVIFRMSGIQELDDLVQETFLKAWKGKASFQSGSSERTWVARIAMNTAIDRLRKRSTRSESQHSVYEDSQPAPEDQGDMRDVLMMAMDQLEEPFKSTCVLVAIEGFSSQEAAEALQVEEGTVRSRVSRARRLLKDFLQSKGVQYGLG